MSLARKRRRLTAKALAAAAGVSPVTISRLGKGHNPSPDESTVASVASALGFPVGFFFGDALDDLDRNAASFRSMTSMTARERDAALASGELAFLVADWLSERFNLPDEDIPDLGGFDPEAAARLLRERWGIGERPIRHLMKLLESKGVLFFSLCEHTRRVDAFSCWRNERPFVFLNTMKTAERSRLDAAHELGHLVLHRHGGPQGKVAEAEANAFASSFLMPRADVLSHLPRVLSAKKVISAKKRWRVSALALTHRLHRLGILSDWQSRTFFIQLGKRGYRDGEPDGIDREESVLWASVLKTLWSEGVTKAHIAAELDLPAAELEILVDGLLGQESSPNRGEGLRLV